MSATSLFVFLIALLFILLVATFDLSFRNAYIQLAFAPAKADEYDQRPDELKHSAIRMIFPYLLPLVSWFILSTIINEQHAFGIDASNGLGVMIVGAVAIVTTMFVLALALQSIRRYKAEERSTEPVIGARHRA